MRIGLASCAAALCLLTACATPTAGTAPAPDPHAAHRAAAPAAKPADAAPAAGAHTHSMGKMHEMHQRMKDAKTPQQRNALTKQLIESMRSQLATLEALLDGEAGRTCPAP